MPSELEIIHRLGRYLASPDVAVHDAYFDSADRAIFTTDMLIEGHHFNLAYFSPQDLGWKAAAVNISDIAATGGRLRCLLVSLGLPQDASLDFVEGVYEGLFAAVQSYGGQIVGGDTVSAPVVTLNVTAVGELPVGHCPGRRNTASPGDRVVATGFHGLSQVGLQVLQQNLSGYEAARQAHLRPQPRLAEGQALSGHCSRFALMDSSDGLADAALKIAHASSVQVLLDAECLAVHPEVARFSGTQAVETLLYGGEDFQLVACVPADELPGDAWRIIGSVRAADGEPGAFLQEGGSVIPLRSDRTYQHFGGGHA